MSLASGGNIDFDVNSNVNWTISDDANWLTLNSNNGTNNATLTATTTTNSSGANRTATITISENGGTLKSIINVTQSYGTFDPNNAVSLAGITVTGVGTQAGENIPENTLDGNESSRWSANSTDGSAYLTYDLQCKKTVTSVSWPTASMKYKWQWL